MKTFFDSMNVSKRHFAVLGKTSDNFCNEALQLFKLDELLHSHLIALGYQRIVLYSPAKMIYFLDAQSKELTFNERAAVQQMSIQKRLIMGPLVSRSLNVKPNEKTTDNSGSLSFGKMNNLEAIERLNQCMKNPKIKTAIIITDAAHFITSFRHVRTERGNEDITPRVTSILSSWENSRNYDDENIAIWVFQNADPVDLYEKMKNESNLVWNRFFEPMFRERKEKREGTIIDVLTPSSGEIKNLINYHRLKDGVQVDMGYINEAALELEKKAKGQKVQITESCNSLELLQVSKLILSMKNSGGINAKNIEKLFGKNERVSAFTKLDRLSGMDNFKKYIRDLTGKATRLNLKKKVEVGFRSRIMRHPVSSDMARLNLHIALTGNPGTGKTTVAKLMGEIYYELGLLSTGHVVKVTKDDLCAGFVGQTAIKTKERINEAMGGVLFIDEAYTLARGGANDYGQEAIDTLVEAMTDRMGEFAVVIAGYPEDIAALLKTNQGLTSRFTQHIALEDNSAKELADIFTNYLLKRSFEISNELKEVLASFFQRYYDATPKGKGGEWASARTAENLAEKMKDICEEHGDTVVDVKHMPHHLQRLLGDIKPKTELPKTISVNELKLSKSDIFKADGSIDIKKMEQAVLFVENTKNNGTVFFGTGFLITPSGYFVTCNHVIEDGQEINVRLRTYKNGIQNDEIFRCELMSTFKDLDIALLKLDTDRTDLPYLSLERDPLYEYEKGESVCLSGYPFGKRTAHDCTYTEGKISSTRLDHELECINLDISGKCGNSGGAVIDKKTGKVIGVFVGSIVEGEGLVEEINYMRPIKYFWSKFVR